MPDTDDAALVRRLVRMDEGAWEEFAGRYYRPLLAFVSAACGADAEVAQEVVQMAFVRCVKSISTFDPQKGSLFGWLKVVTANEWHTLVRKERKHSSDVPLSTLEDGAWGALSVFDHSPLPEEVLARKDFQLAVQDALMSLADRYRDCLVMKYVDGLKVSEIAAAFHTSEASIESTLTRSREAFAKAFEARAKDRAPQSMGLDQ